VLRKLRIAPLAILSLAARGVNPPPQLRMLVQETLLQLACHHAQELDLLPFRIAVLLRIPVTAPPIVTLVLPWAHVHIVRELLGVLEVHRRSAFPQRLDARLPSPIVPSIADNSLIVTLAPLLLLPRAPPVLTVRPALAPHTVTHIVEQEQLQLPLLLIALLLLRVVRLPVAPLPVARLLAAPPLVPLLAAPLLGALLLGALLLEALLLEALLLEALLLAALLLAAPLLAAPLLAAPLLLVPVQPPVPAPSLLLLHQQQVAKMH